MNTKQVNILSNENGNLRINIDDRIDTNNAKAIEDDLNTLIENNEFEKLTLDFSNLDYISSVGIRILVKLTKRYKNFSVENVIPEVDDILRTTGIDKIIPISRKLREFSAEGLEQIGAGFNGAVYRLDDETILKVINKWNSLEDIKRERNSAQKAFLMGIPSAISFDVVKVGDLYGIIYELLNAQSLDKELIDNVDQIESLGRRLGKLGRLLTSKIVDDEEIIDKKKEFLNRLDYVKEILDEKDFKLIKNLYESFPDRNNFIHGDFHPGNVLFQGDEMLLIDFSYSGKGHPIFDILSFTVPIIGSATTNKSDKDINFFNSLTGIQNKKLWRAFLEGFLNVSDSELIDWIMSQLFIIVYANLIISLAQRLKNLERLKNESSGNLNSTKSVADADTLKENLAIEIKFFRESIKDFDNKFFNKLDELLIVD